MKYPYICDITLKRLTMKRLRLGLWACFCFCAATTLMGQNKVKTTAEKVMLFIDGAQVTRTKQVDIPAGNSTLIFTGLSPYMDAQSMQVSAKGKLTVTAVNRQYNYIDSLAVSEKQQSLQKELKKIEKQQKEQIGAITDISGKYSITIPNGQNKLQFSYIGYQTQTRDIQGNIMNVTLQEDTQALDEVVVVGYGAERKPLMAGAVSGLKVNHKKDIQYEEETSMALDVEQSQGQMGYEFEIKVPYTIPSDNKPVVAEIGYYELPASYTYQSTPKIDKDAFLIAQVTDWEKLNLLEGEANVYFENTFIGKSIMNVTQQNDTLSFSLGRDKRIMIQRTKENEYTSRKFMGSNQTQSIAWKLSVRNTRPEPVILTLYDQLPVSRNNNITVTAEEISGGSLDEAKGIITWQITLQPGEQRDLALRYKVKYPKGRNLIIE